MRLTEVFEQVRPRLRRRRGASALGAVVASAALVGALVGAGSVGASTRATAGNPHRTTGCQLGNGVKHVIELTFDNVHFFRDNPNVPSDLEMMPNLLNFFEQNGTMLSNSHTPLIAHTGDDILTTLHRAVRRPARHADLRTATRPTTRDGTTDPAGSFAYWTDPVFDTAEHAEPGPRHEPVDGLLGTAAGHIDTGAASRTRSRPRPGCRSPAPAATSAPSATANIELENTAVDIPKVFGAGSPEVQQLNADTDTFKDAEMADYVGVAVHCAARQRVLHDREAVQVPADHAVADRRRRPAARRARRLQRLPGARSATATSRRSSAPERPTSATTASRSRTPPATSST